MPRYCIECNKKTACYNFPDQKTKLYCSNDKKPGMVTIGYPMCITCKNLGVRKYACFNYPSKLGPLYCKIHSKKGMIDVKKHRKGASKLRTTLAKGDPEVCKDWHPDNLKVPEEYARYSNAKVKWLCHKCGHEWESIICNRTGKNKRGCPVCANKAIATDGRNSVKVLCPKLVKEWAPKNPKGPECYTVGSGYNAWWQCPKRNCHLYQATIYKRVHDNRGCPYCSHQRLCTTDYCNSIREMYPNLAKQLHPDNPKKAHEYIAGGNKKLLWQCLVNPAHVWTASPASRITFGSDCPKCKRSKMERHFKKWAATIGVVHRDEVRLKTFTYKKKLPYDFLIPDNILVELDGRQHFDKTSYYSRLGNFKENVWKDLLKTWYAIKNGYYLIRLSYLDIDSVAQVMDDMLEMLKDEGLYYPQHLGTNVQKVYDIHAQVTSKTTENELQELNTLILNILI